MKKKEFVNMIVECVREVLNEDKCNCKDTCSCKTNETKVSACDDCGKPDCLICNPKDSKNPRKKDYINPSKLNLMLNNALKRNASSAEIKRIKNLIQMMQAKSKIKNRKVNESGSSLHKKINTALEKYPAANEKTVNAYVRAHAKLGKTITDLRDDAKSQKWNVDTAKAIYNILGNIKR